MSQESFKKINFSKDEAFYGIEKNPFDRKGYFKNIKDYVVSQPAYKDPYSRIIIEGETIYFGHNLKEIQASFPKLLDFILMSAKGHIYTYLEEGYIKSNNNMRIDFQFLNPLETRQKQTQKEAKEFFENQNFSLGNFGCFSSSIELSENRLEPSDILLDLISKNQSSVAIGERHNHRSSKKLLIDNMESIKKQGVDTIYLEHVFCDTQKDMFEAYFESSTLNMPVMLKDYLKFLDKIFGLYEEEKGFNPYSFTGLVLQAKRHGIQIIPIDTDASYSVNHHLLSLFSTDENDKDPAKRYLMMNYMAAQQYDQNRKSLFFVGSAHINQINSNVPGIKEITGCPTMVVEDKVDNEEELSPENHPAKPDFLVYMNCELSKEAEQLILEHDLLVNPFFFDFACISNISNRQDIVEKIEEKKLDDRGDLYRWEDIKALIKQTLSNTQSNSEYLLEHLDTSIDDILKLPEERKATELLNFLQNQYVWYPKNPGYQKTTKKIISELYEDDGVPRRNFFLDPYEFNRNAKLKDEFLKENNKFHYSNSN